RRARPLSRHRRAKLRDTAVVDGAEDDVRAGYLAGSSQLDQRRVRAVLRPGGGPARRGTPVTRRLTIVCAGVPVAEARPGEEAIALDDFKQLVRSGRALARVASYREGRILMRRLEGAGRPLPLALALRALSRGPVYLEDVLGRRSPLPAGRIAAWA